MDNRQTSVILIDVKYPILVYQYDAWRSSFKGRAPWYDVESGCYAVSSLTSDVISTVFLYPDVTYSKNSSRVRA